MADSLKERFIKIKGGNKDFTKYPMRGVDIWIISDEGCGYPATTTSSLPYATIPKAKGFFFPHPLEKGDLGKKLFPTSPPFFPRSPLQETSVHFLNNPFYYCYLLEASILLSFFAKIFARSTQHHFIPLLTSYDH